MIPNIDITFRGQTAFVIPPDFRRSITEEIVNTIELLGDDSRLIANISVVAKWNYPNVIAEISASLGTINGITSAQRDFGLNVSYNEKTGDEIKTKFLEQFIKTAREMGRTMAKEGANLLQVSDTLEKRCAARNVKLKSEPAATLASIPVTEPQIAVDPPPQLEKSTDLACPNCGKQMVRSGGVFKCHNCGETL